MNGPAGAQGWRNGRPVGQQGYPLHRRAQLWDARVPGETPEREPEGRDGRDEGDPVARRAEEGER